jgi:Tannase and feruloyl esterase
MMAPMKTRILTGLMLAGVMGAAPLAAPEHAECSHLVMLKLPDVKVTEAVSVPAKPSGAITAAHCRVAGVIGTEIKFSLLLPEEWNRKFLMGGGGGFVGSVQNQALSAVNAGYATVGTDTGHIGGTTDAAWALNNLERQLNFGYLAVHRTAEVAKAILRSYYGATETRAYFSGCSNGGRQALMEAQRFPDDFDGIVAGAPAADFMGIGAQFIKDVRAQFPDPKNLMPLLPPDTLQSIAAQILDKCDALDGVKDGVMEDPRQCKVDVASLTGLTPAQHTALKAIYAPTSVRGEMIYSGQPFGGEGEGAGWPAWITGAAARPGQPAGPSLRFAFGTQIFKYLVFGDPDWDYTKYDLSTWKADTKRTASFINATSPDLDAFKAKGHKLLLWHGWADAGLTPLATIKYYDEVKARDPKMGDYVRMFMMPGVLHCGGGAGPDTADWAAAIDSWVDAGKAPDRIVASKLANGAVTRSRPLCAYPQHAVYNGTGSTDEAASFVCKP